MTLIHEEENDLIAELERMDRFLEGDEAGDIPLEVLRGRGIDIPAMPPADEAELRVRLLEIVEGMADIGMMLEDTDHLSDAELYRYLVDDALLVETMLSQGVVTGTSARSVAGAKRTTRSISAITRTTRTASGGIGSLAMCCRRKRSRRTIAIGFCRGMGRGRREAEDGSHSSGHGQTLFRVARDGFDLGAGHAREPFEEIVHTGAVLEIGE